MNQDLGAAALIDRSKEAERLGSVNGGMTGALWGHITPRSTQNRRETARSQPQVKVHVKHIRPGRWNTCTRPGPQADSMLPVVDHRRGLWRGLPVGLPVADHPDRI